MGGWKDCSGQKLDRWFGGFIFEQQQQNGARSPDILQNRLF